MWAQEAFQLTNSLCVCVGVLQQHANMWLAFHNRAISDCPWRRDCCHLSLQLLHMCWALLQAQQQSAAGPPQPWSAASPPQPHQVAGSAVTPSRGDVAVA